MLKHVKQHFIYFSNNKKSYELFELLVRNAYYYINKLTKYIKTINMENKLLMVEHPERGIWYFTNIQKAADWIGIQRTQLLQCLGKRKLEYKDYTFEWVDGSDVIYKYINPEK